MSEAEAYQKVCIAADECNLDSVPVTEEGQVMLLVEVWRWSDGTYHSEAESKVTEFYSDGVYFSA